MSLRDEIFEQPDAISRLLDLQSGPVREVAARIGLAASVLERARALVGTTRRRVSCRPWM